MGQKAGMNYCSIIPKIIEVDKTIKTLFYYLAPLYKPEHSKEQRVTIPLFTSLHSTSESILILLQNQAVFDADILLRSIMEGTVKYCYLMVGNSDEKESKCDEYEHILCEIDRINDHKKAKEAVEVLKTFSQNNTGPFESMILSEEEEAVLSEKYPAKTKNRITNEWSYQALLKALSSDHEEYKAQLGTLSTYAMICHNCHYDWTGVSARNEEIMSSPDGSNELFDYMHALRIVSNVLSMYLFRVLEYMRCNHFSNAKLEEEYLRGLNLAMSFGKELDLLLENCKTHDP